MSKTNCTVRGQRAEFLGFTLKDGNPVVAVRLPGDGLFIGMEHPKHVNMDTESEPIPVGSAFNVFNDMADVLEKLLRAYDQKQMVPVDAIVGFWDDARKALRSAGRQVKVQS